jgi:DNA-binding NarL/FixJ family response regulator
MKTKAMIVDGHASVRQMLSAQLQDRCGCEVVGEAATGFEALAVFRRCQPGLVVLELVLPEMDGTEVLRQLQSESRQLRLLVYSGTRDGELILEALRERPHGFVHKDDSLPTLLEAVHAVTRGCSYFTPFATNLIDSARGRISSRPSISGSERMILQMVAEGLSNKEMAQRMHVSSKTVEYHRSRLMAKLNLHDVATLTRYAVRIGLVAVA